MFWTGCAPVRCSHIWPPWPPNSSRKTIRARASGDSFATPIRSAGGSPNRTLPCTEITDEVVDRYIGGMHRSTRAGYTTGYRAHNGRGLPRLLDLLRGSGVTPPATQLVATVDPLLAGFRTVPRPCSGPDADHPQRLPARNPSFPSARLSRAQIQTGLGLDPSMWRPTSRCARDSCPSPAAAIRLRRCGRSSAT